MAATSDELASLLAAAVTSSDFGPIVTSILALVGAWYPGKSFPRVCSDSVSCGGAVDAWKTLHSSASSCCETELHYTNDCEAKSVNGTAFIPNRLRQLENGMLIGRKICVSETAMTQLMKIAVAWLIIGTPCTQVFLSTAKDSPLGLHVDCTA